MRDAPLLCSDEALMPLAVNVVQILEHEVLWTQVLVTQARTNLAVEGINSFRL
jgi:hypothetical protein